MGTLGTLGEDYNDMSWQEKLSLQHCNWLLEIDQQTDI